MEHRRRVPRLSAGLFGICQIEGESDWRDCRVEDMSSLGLGLTLHHFWPASLVGRHITVEAPAVGASVNVRFAGEIMNADHTAGGVIRVGIEFDGLTELEVALTGVLRSLLDPDFIAVPSPAKEEAPDYAISGPNA